MSSPNATNAMTAAVRNAASRTLDPISLGRPLEVQLARWRHVAEQRRRRDDRGAREVALAADAHPVLPVAVERRDRALTLSERVVALPEARAAPAHPDLPADGPQHVRDRFAAEPRVRPLDRVLHRARAGEDHEVRRGLRVARIARVADDERGLEEVVVAAVRAR